MRPEKQEKKWYGSLVGAGSSARSSVFQGDSDLSCDEGRGHMLVCGRGMLAVKHKPNQLLPRTCAARASRRRVSSSLRV